MKRQILISLILLSSVISLKAQALYDNGDKVGIGTNSPGEKLTIEGGNLYISNGENATFYSSAHNLVFSGLSGSYCHKIYTFRPAWGTDGNTWSCMALQTANRSGEYFTKVQLSSEGSSYFTGGYLGIGTDKPGEKLTIEGGNLYISNGENATIYSSVHNLIFSGLAGNYCHKIYTFRPAWGTAGNTWTALALQTANTNGEYFTKIQLSAGGDSYFTGGNLGIGTDKPACTLDVKGTIHANEIKVDLNGADFVFEKDYKLMPLGELEKFVKEQKHLPEIVPAKEMEKNGTELGDLNSKLLQKMEEMTLYMIEQNKKIESLEQIVKVQNDKIEKLEAVSK